MKSSTLEKKRLYGFDLIRLASIFAIIVFHANEAVFWTDTHPLHPPFSIYRFALAIAQSITFSGFTVIALSFFLMGRGRRTHVLPLIIFLGIGILVLATFQSDPPFTGFYWEWDIYEFLLVSLIAVQAVAPYPRLHPWLAGAAFAATWIPAWSLVPNSSEAFSQALIGICPPAGAGAWPLLPWLAWPLLFYALGSWLKHSELLREKSRTLSRTELLLWLFLLTTSVPLYGAYYGVSLGPHFYCQTLRQPPLIFWAHLVWVVFAMRWSLTSRANEWLAGQGWARAISNLCWSKHFGATYLAHLPLLGIGILLREDFVRQPWMFEIYYLSLFPAAEGLVRLMMALRSKLRRHDGNGAEN